jgi:hypothetical protein
MFALLATLRAALLVAFIAAGCVQALPQPSAPPSPELLEVSRNPELLIHAAEIGEFTVVPGPGLPSLESLNLTSRDLVVRALDRIERHKEAQGTFNIFPVQIHLIGCRFLIDSPSYDRGQREIGLPHEAVHSDV